MREAEFSVIPAEAVSPLRNPQNVVDVIFVSAYTLPTRSAVYCRPIVYKHPITMSIALPAVFIYPTRRCNYRCSYCFTSSDSTWSRETFVLRNWQRLIDEARQVGIAEIRLSGGEPLLIHDIRDRCEVIRDNCLSYTITTNGSLLSKHLDWIQQMPPSTLWVSYHREYTSIDRFVVSAREVCARDIRVGINLFDLDLIAFPDLMGQLIRVGVSRFKLINTTPIGRAVSIEAGSVRDPGTVRRIVAMQRGELHGDVEIRAAFPLIENALMGPQTCVLRERSLLSIDFDGSIYPCCVTVGFANARVGDLAVESLADIVARLADAPATLPCRQLLGAVATGTANCPLALTTIG